MRDFLMELYLKYGEREFAVAAIIAYRAGDIDISNKAMREKYISSNGWGFIITHKALEFIKQNDS